jgi:cell fate (sporulation/competence/biofilm development) regulator YmcA (YheA/YmcA/DUF963 family)
MYKEVFEPFGIKCIDIDLDYIKTGDELSKFIADNDYVSGLSEYETKLKKDHEYIVDKLEEIRKAAKLIIDFGLPIGKDAFEIRVELIKGIKDRIEKSTMEFMNMLYIKQKSCQHVYKNVGHDSHYDYYMCDKCGSQDRW